MPTKKTKDKPMQFEVFRDKNSRTCIKVSEIDNLVRFIPMSIDNGLIVEETSKDSFYHRFQLIVDYPIARACQLFVEYSRVIGADSEALDYLGQIITIPKEDYDMATAKKKAKTGEPKKSKDTTESKKAIKAKSQPKAKAKKGKSGKYPSAAQMFKELIMRGTMTDDQIFGKVQEEFGLDDSKKGYVKWYRNHLKKGGQNPPEPK